MQLFILTPSPSHRLLEVLGSGQFGTVTKGVWLCEEGGIEIPCEVAVKTMTEEATEEDKVKFLQEAAQWRSQRGAEGTPAPPSGLRLCSTSSFY